MGFCTNCGKPLTEGAAFCTNCGQKVGAKTIVPPSQNTHAPVPPVPPYPPANPARPAPSAPLAPETPKAPVGGQRDPAPWNNGVSSPKSTQKPEKEKKKKSFLLPFLIAFGAALIVLGTGVAVAYFTHLWPFSKQDQRPGQTTLAADDETELTRRPDASSSTSKRNTTEAVPETPGPSESAAPSETEPPETRASETEPPETEPPTEAPTEEPAKVDPAFLGYWYGDQRTIFILYEDGTVDYFDGGVDGNRLNGTWSLDEDTGLFELDLFGGGNRFHLYTELSRGYESTIMYRMAMDWKKSTTQVWYYENFFRERPEKFVEGEDRMRQPYEP